MADLSLIMGRTVRQAFEVATTTASSETGPLKEQQFMLLPPEGDHDLVVFDDVQVGEHTLRPRCLEPWRSSVPVCHEALHSGPSAQLLTPVISFRAAFWVSLGEFVDESPPPIANTCDRPPVPFIGRNVAVQEVRHSATLRTSQQLGDRT